MGSNNTITLVQFKEERALLIDQPLQDPHQLSLDLTNLSDRLLQSLYHSPPGTALIAVGSYADFELTPNSDLDVVLLHRPKLDVEDLAQSIWYPVWDSGLKIDYSVRTPKEAIKMAESDPRVLNGLCRPRLIAGDPQLLSEVDELLQRAWKKKRRFLLHAVVSYAKARHSESGELAYLLEPDLKEAKGGLRDFSVIKALEHLEGVDLLGAGMVGVYEAQKVEQNTRVALHHVNGRASNRLSLQDQDAISIALGLADADELMSMLAQAGKSLSFMFDSITDELSGHAPDKGYKRPVLPKPFRVVGNQVELELGSSTRAEFGHLLKLAAIAATNQLRISQRTLESLIDANIATPRRFREEDLQNLVTFLATGAQMIPIAETLDHFRLFEVILPEWKQVRSKPQRNAYHTYTVDRHLLETVAHAATMRRNVRRPDLLLIAALLHDIGKGMPGDHTVAGVEVAPVICERFGLNEKDSAIIVRLVKNHLTLADSATRRDINDPATIRKVATSLAEPLVVELLQVLTEADSLATGPSAWSSWKAGLIADLARNALRELEGLQPEEDSFPGNEFDDLIARAESGWAMQTDSESLTIVAPDKPGLFALVTGTLALVGADITSARIASKGNMAIENLQLMPNNGRLPDWTRFKRELQKTLDDPSSLSTRISEKAKNYARARRKFGVQLVPPRVVVAPDASSRATVVEVWAPNRIGLVYDITTVMYEMSLSIAHAKLTTLGDDVVDSFYLTDEDGARISDTAKVHALSAALVEVLGAVPD